MKVEEQELKNRNGPKNLGDEAIANDTDVHTKTLDSAENENGIVGMRENGLGETKENESMGVFCATTFDDVYCWPRTPADTVVTIPCPQYVQGFKHMVCHIGLINVFNRKHTYKQPRHILLFPFLNSFLNNSSTNTKKKNNMQYTMYRYERSL